MARIGGATFLLAALSSPICGWLSDRWISAGATATRVRKTFMGVGMICNGLFLVGCAAAPDRLLMSLLLLDGRVVWSGQFKPQRGNADPGRPPRCRTMDGRAELCGEPGWRGCARTHRISGWPHRKVLLAFPDHVGDCLDGGGALGVCGWSARAGGLEDKPRRSVLICSRRHRRIFGSRSVIQFPSMSKEIEIKFRVADLRALGREVACGGISYDDAADTRDEHSVRPSRRSATWTQRAVADPQVWLGVDADA